MSGAWSELALVVLVIGAPAAISVLWQWWDDRWHEREAAKAAWLAGRDERIRRLERELRIGGQR